MVILIILCIAVSVVWWVMCLLTVIKVHPEFNFLRSMLVSSTSWAIVEIPAILIAKGVYEVFIWLF